MELSTVSEKVDMIHASDFDELVYTCSEMLQSGKADIVGSIVETIHTDSSYAAMTVMALYKAAEELSIDTHEIDNIIMLAEKNCSPIKVQDYRRLYNKFRTFEKALNQIQMANDNFFVPPTQTLH